MDIVEVANQSLKSFHEDDMVLALSQLKKLHQEVYESCTIMHDMKKASAFDLHELIQQDFPYLRDCPDDGTPHSHHKQTFCKTAKMIEEVLSDFLMH